MKHKTDNQDHQNDLPDAVVPDVDDSRRKFNKAGLIAPVMLSFSSKPVWAVDCTSSTLASGNLSQACTPPLHGFTAAELINADVWPLPLTKTTLFDSVFVKVPSFSPFGSSATLLSVLSGADIDASLTDAQWQAAFGDCTGDVSSLKTNIKPYAVQSIVSALNALYFPSYAVHYPGMSTFYSAPSGSACNSRASSMNTLTATYAAITTS